MRGLDVFKEHFEGYEDCYVIIGGTACAIIFEEVGSDFRMTKDFDLVLIVENIGIDFVRVFMDFIQLGGYKNIAVGQEKRNFYRFEKPQNDMFPAMIELFSRKPTTYDIVENSHLLPIHIDDDVASLSAILLNDDYYNFLLRGRKEIGGVSILDELRLIPFKAKAWCELTDRHNNGEAGLTKHIKKHRKDIVILLTLIGESNLIQLNDGIETDMRRFVEAMKTEILDEHTTGVKNMTTDFFCNRIKEIYNL